MREPSDYYQTSIVILISLIALVTQLLISNIIKPEEIIQILLKFSLSISVAISTYKIIQKYLWNKVIFKTIWRFRLYGGKLKKMLDLKHE